MKKTIQLIAAIAGFTALSAAAQANSLVDTLVAKGYLTSAEAAELTHSPGVVIKTGKHVEALKFSGRMQFQYNALSTDVKDAANPSDTNYFYARRLRLGTKAMLAEDITGYINMELSDAGSEGSENEFRLDQAYIKYSGFDSVDLAVGYKKVPFGYEETTSSSKLKTVERSAANRYFIETLDAGGRYTGVYADGDILDSGVAYTVAFTNARGGDDDDNDGTANDMKYTARLQYKPELGEDYGKLLVGADATSTQWDGSDGINEVTAYTVYGNYKMGDFNVSAAYYMAEVKDGIAAGTDADPTAYSVQVTYAIDENWEPVISYSAVDTDGQFNADISDLIRKAPDSGIAGGDYDEVESFFFGVNYYFLGNDAKLQAGYEMATFEKQSANAAAEADVSGFRAQVQLNF